MAQHIPRSLKHEYELYVENEIENYKESVSRSAILKIGDEAAESLRTGEQFAMDELLLESGCAFLATIPGGGNG